MKFADYKVSLDLHASSAPVSIHATQSDTGRRICVNLTERGKPYEISDECEAIFAGTKPDGKVLWNGCRIENNTIIYEITEQTVAAVGWMPVQIRLYGSGGRLISTPDFVLLVDAPLVGDDVVVAESQNEISALTQLIADVIDLKQDLTGNVEDIVRRIIAEDPPQDGVTPHIGENGNWYIGEMDTGNPSRGETPVKGVDYFDGLNGVTPEISVGEVVTLEPGSDATVTVAGTDEKPVLNFGIPRGETGVPGDNVLIVTLDGSTRTASHDAGDIYTAANTGKAVLATFNRITMPLYSATETEAKFNICILLDKFCLNAEYVVDSSGAYALGMGGGYLLPEHTTSENGKILQIVEGEAVWTDPDGGGTIDQETVRQIVEDYLKDNPPDVDIPVRSVNGKTGAVVLTAADIGAQPVGSYLTEETDPSVPAWAKSANKPTYTKKEIGLGNVDNVRQYSANNPPPYPVTSVNGNTGAVELDAVAVGARPNTWMPSAADVGAVPATRTINGKKLNANITLTAQEVGALPDTYTPPDQTAAQVGADPAGTASSLVSGHNTNGSSHNDIRLLIEGLTTRLNALANSTDEDLDQMAELVAYIKSNKSLIDEITTSKVSVADIVNNLTTNVTNKPLSAAQGVALKALIDAITVPTKVSELTNDSKFITAAGAPVQSVNGETGAVQLTASDVGARSSSWMPTAAQVGARPDTWTPSASDVGALPSTTKIPAKPEDIGAQPAGIYLTEETDPTVPGWAKQASKPAYTASEVGARPSTWTPSAADVGAVSYNAQSLTEAQKAQARENIGIDEAFKAELVAAVIESLGGNPVFGYVDENNNIIVSGNIPDGTYSVKYELEDGETVNIGSLVLDTNVYYSVQNNLTQCTNSNNATQAIGGQPYSATITANSGYELKSVVVTMGGNAVTVTNGVINIGNVTGNIVITAVAEEIKAKYTNLADSTSADWASGSRINSSGVVKNDEPGFVVTNYIPVTKGQTVHIKNAQLLSGYNQGHYKSDKTLAANSASATLISQGQVVSADYDASVTLYKNVGQYGNSSDSYNAWADNLVYVRLTIKPTGAESDIIITVNENIV